MFLESMEKIEEFVLKHTVEEIVKIALKDFYELSKIGDLEILKLKFDNEVFNETSKKSDFFIEHIEDIKYNIKEYKKIYEFLYDDKSKETYIYMLNAKLFFDNRNIEKVYEEEDIYFDASIYGVRSIKTYVDCGAYTGDSIIKLSFINPNLERIYGFEPIKEIADRAVDNISRYIDKDKVKIVFKATYDRVGHIGIEKTKNMLGDSEVNIDSERIIETTTIDEEIKERVDLIKYDVEGSEKEAIKGSRKHILEDYPILAVCIYHLKDDYHKIPNLVLSIRDDYDIFVRQYDPEVYSETVMYFVPKNKKINIEKDDFIKLYSKEENSNIIQHIKDKKWFIRQIRNKNTIIEEQVESRQSRILELETWVKNLEEAKKYLEEQAESRQSRILELETWISRLEEGKNYIENRLIASENIIKEKKDENLKLEQEISKLKYKVNSIKNDFVISKILKFRKLDF